MLVPMRTSWHRHRSHAVANLAFRAASAAGFAAGMLVALYRAAPGPRACDVQRAACLAGVLRHEALVHVLPPVAGLVAGMVLGGWLARGVHRYART